MQFLSRFACYSFGLAHHRLSQLMFRYMCVKKDDITFCANLFFTFQVANSCVGYFKGIMMVFSALTSLYHCLCVIRHSPVASAHEDVCCVMMNNGHCKYRCLE